jgi:hypothetical protein
MIGRIELLGGLVTGAPPLANLGIRPRQDEYGSSLNFSII